MPIVLLIAGLSGVSFIGGFATGVKSTSLLTTAALLGGGAYILSRS